jgi:5-methylcytosine-specific restriction enzyme A
MPMRAPMHRPPGYKPSDAMRPSAAKRGYGAKWQQARAGFLVHHPRCVLCLRAATRVDHIEPHRGDMAKFWDKSNWQPLCEHCHNRKSRAERLTTPLKG